MGTNDSIKGTFDWSVGGLEKLAEMERRLISLESHMDTKLPAASNRTRESSDKVTQSHRLGGEQAAKYLTTAGMLSGGLQRLGVQNELVARSFTVFGDLLSGASGPAGAIMVAVGAIGALAAELYNQEQAAKRASESTRTYLDLLIEKASGTGALASISRVTLRNERALLTDEIESLNKQIEQKGAERGREGREMQRFSPVLMAIHRPDIQYAKLTTELNELTSALIKVEAQKNKIDAAIFGYPTTTYDPNTYRSEPGEPGKPGKPGNKPGSDSFGSLINPNLSARVPPSAGMMGFGDKAEDPWAVAAKQSQDSTDLQIANLSVLMETHKKTYNAMSGITMSTSRLSSMYVQKLVEGENMSKLRGLTIAKYVAAGGAAAVMEGIAQIAKIKASEQIALALGTVENPGFSASHFAAAVAWGALGGAASGVAAGIQSRTTADFNRETSRQNASGGTSGGGSAGGSSGSNPGVRIANSGASVGTINYNFIVTYQGATVYGDGGTRDWFYRELVPLINEGMSAGSISRN